MARDFIIVEYLWDRLECLTRLFSGIMLNYYIRLKLFDGTNTLAYFARASTMEKKVL